MEEIFEAVACRLIKSAGDGFSFSRLRPSDVVKS
jgi:hypothetical protein